MSSLAVQLKNPGNCGNDFTNNNPIVLQAYDGFISYQTMFQAGCQKDKKGTYCECLCISVSMAQRPLISIPKASQTPSPTRPPSQTPTLTISLLTSRFLVVLDRLAMLAFKRRWAFSPMPHRTPHSPSAVRTKLRPSRSTLAAGPTLSTQRYPFAPVVLQQLSACLSHLSSRCFWLSSIVSSEPIPLFEWLIDEITSFNACRDEAYYCSYFIPSATAQGYLNFVYISTSSSGRTWQRFENISV